MKPANLVPVGVHGGSEKQNAWAERIQKSAFPYLEVLAPGFVHGVKDPSSSDHENKFALPRDSRFWINAFKDGYKELPAMIAALNGLKEKVNVVATGLVYSTENDKVNLVVASKVGEGDELHGYLIDGDGKIVHETDASSRWELQGQIELKLSSLSRRNTVFLQNLDGYATSGVSDAVRGTHSEAVKPAAGANWKRYYNYGDGGRSLKYGATSRRRY